MNKIRKKRENLGWTIRELAQKMRVTHTTINFWENGVKQPRPANRIKLAKVLRTSQGNLFPEKKDNRSGILEILLIEDNPGDARLIKELLLEFKRLEKVNFHWVESLAEGISFLKKDPIDIILLDLSLPDSQGLITFQKIYSYEPEIPIIVLTGLDDDEVALDALRRGSQDYLVKGRFDSYLLGHSIRYALERQQFIVDHNKAEKALKEKNDNFQIVFNLMSDGVGIIQDEILVSVNPSFLAIWGYRDESELIGKPVADLFVNEKEARLFRHIGDENSEFREFYGVGKIGKKVLANICSKGIVYNGNPAKMLIMKQLF
ncbi:MAG: response regulator [SAR324 cluster bacterium]|nr:response regulator [SAR324 cluster bacterium]